MMAPHILLPLLCRSLTRKRPDGWPRSRLAPASPSHPASRHSPRHTTQHCASTRYALTTFPITHNTCPALTILPSLHCCWPTHSPASPLCPSNAPHPHPALPDPVSNPFPCPSTSNAPCPSPSSPTRVALTVQLLPLSQHLLYVPRHDAVHLPQLVCQLAKVALCPRVHVQALGLLDERVCGQQGAAGMTGVSEPRKCKRGGARLAPPSRSLRLHPHQQPPACPLPPFPRSTLRVQVSPCHPCQQR